MPRLFPSIRTSGRRSVAAQSHRLPLPVLIAFAAAIFVSTTGEFLPGGLLPNIAGELGLSIGAVGQLITAFAITVVISTAPIAWFTRRLPRTGLLLCAVAVVSAANLAAAFAPDFGWLVTTRVVGGLGHGLFWSVAAAYVANLVPRERLGRATAITSGGASLAGILGGPLANALGQAAGWRSAFLAVGVAGCVCALVLFWVLPTVTASPERSPRERSRAQTGGDSLLPILGLCVVIILVVVANCFGTYVAPWLSDIAKIPYGAIPFVLLASGVAGAVGVAVVGMLVDRAPRATLIVCGATLAGAYLLLPVAAASGSAVFVLVLSLSASAAFAGVPLLLQTTMMKIASPERRNLAAALQTTAINVGIGGSAAVGGLLIAGPGLAALPPIAGTLTIAAFIVASTWDLFVPKRAQGHSNVPSVSTAARGGDVFAEGSHRVLDE